MPNHVHGIIELKRNDSVGTRHVVSLPDNTENPVGTSHVMSLHTQNQFSKSIPGSISVIIQQYKSSVTRLINKNNISHIRWQSRFYEHIIRNEQSCEQIADYIINNPKNWKEDDLFNFTNPIRKKL
jgi:REP element-mobilizing transposase RayT